MLARMEAVELKADPVVALVGGGAVFLAGVASVGAGRVSGAFLLGALAWSVGLAVLALGLPGRAGVFGSGRAVRLLLVRAASLSLATGIASSFGSVPSERFESPAVQALSWAFLVVELAALVLLVAGAILVGRAPDASTRARNGLVALALVAVVSSVLPYLVLAALAPRDVQIAADGLFWVSRLFALLTCAVGVWFAWPWLQPRVDAAVAAVARAYRRYVDSTP